MNPRFLVFLLLPLGLSAQDRPIEIPNNIVFATDFDVVVPKHRFSIGARALSGASASFQGVGTLESVSDIGGFEERFLNRTYHDGVVNVDGRGRLVDDGIGNVIVVPIPSDGKTNNWRYTSSPQANADGNIEMSTYKVVGVDSGPKTKSQADTYGVELTVRRDLPPTAWFNWTLLSGVSLNGINSKLRHREDAVITKVTDTYSVDGVPPPPAPYPGSPGTVPVVDANGNPVNDADGNPAVGTPDNAVLIETDPQERETVVETRSGVFTNVHDLKGAFFTMRAGPSIFFPVTRGFSASVSAGAALIYAGTTYSVREGFEPETGSAMLGRVFSTRSRFMPGVYADANVEYVATDRMGFFLGLIYQSAGSYRQGITSGDSNYSTKVDLSNMAGVHTGMNVRF